MSECPRCGLQWDHTATFRSPGARSERHTWAAPATGIDVVLLGKAMCLQEPGPCEVHEHESREVAGRYARLAAGGEVTQ